jgi:hypothetical protein
MTKTKDDLRFINFLRSMEKALHDVNRIILDSQQREELSEKQVAFVKKMHELYWNGEIRFDAKNIDHTKLKIS